jgi:hypothetical protein
MCTALYTSSFFSLSVFFFVPPLYLIYKEFGLVASPSPASLDVPIHSMHDQRTAAILQLDAILSVAALIICDAAYIYGMFV